MDQITKHSFSCHNSCSDDHDHNDHDHNDHNKLEHCCNHTYFYTSCNYLFREEENPNTMFIRLSCQVTLQSKHDHCDGKASRQNGCRLMDMSVVRRLNTLLEHLLSIECDLIFAIHLQSKHLFCMDVLKSFFEQLHILTGHP